MPEIANLNAIKIESGSKLKCNLAEISNKKCLLSGVPASGTLIHF